MLKRISDVPIKLTFVLGVFIVAGLSVLTVAITTTPDAVGPVGITAVFILVFVVILSTLTLVKMAYKHSTTVTASNLVVWALAPTLVMGLMTLKQLTIIDIILISLFIVLLNVYIRKATNNKT